MLRKATAATFAATLMRLVGCVVLCASGLAAQQRPADLILRNGKILTVDANFSIAQAIAVTGSKISAVGSDADVMKLSGPDTQVIDLKGRTVTPGLMDTHLHYTGMNFGAYMKYTEPQLAIYRVDWSGVKTKDDVLNQIAGIIKKYNFRPGEWIHFNNAVGFMGQANDVTRLHGDIMFNQLNRWELDKAAPNNPIIMSEGIPEYNGLLINGVAMDILWKEYGDFIKANGKYWIDPSGRPDGHLEPPATRPIMMRYMPQMSPAELAPMLRMAQEDLVSTGQTVDSGRYPVYRVAALTLLESRGELIQRTAYGMEDAFGLVGDVNVGLKRLTGIVGNGTEKIWVTSISPISVDGAGSRMCSTQPRAGLGAIDNLYPVGQCHQESEFRGATGKAAPIPNNYYHDWIMASAKYGIRFANTHMGGDRSVALFIRNIAEAQAQYGPDSTKYWASDHCNMINPADLPQAAKLNVMFSCMASIGSQGFQDQWGEKIAQTFAAPVRSMLDLGITVSLEGEGGRGWIGMERLITRKDNDGKLWGPQEAITRPEALIMATRNGSKYVLKEDMLGTLEVGKLADIVVLDRDYLTIPEGDIGEITPQMTIFDGNIVFLHPKFSQEYNLKPPGAVIATTEELRSRGRGQGAGGG